MASIFIFINKYPENKPIKAPIANIINEPVTIDAGLASFIKNGAAQTAMLIIPPTPRFTSPTKIAYVCAIPANAKAIVCIRRFSKFMTLRKLGAIQYPKIIVIIKIM